MAETVHGDFFAQPGVGGGLAAGQLERTGAHVAVLFPGREQPGAGIGTEGLVVAAQDHEQAVRQHGVAVLLAFALFDADEFAFAVDVGDLEGDGFGDAEAGSVAGHQSGAVLEAGDVVEEEQHLFVAEDDGEFVGAFGAGEVLVGPGHFKRGEVEEFQAGDAAVDAFRRELSLVEQVQQVLADGFGVELLGTLVEVTGELGYIMNIAALCFGRQIAQLHVFDHALTEWGHAMAPESGLVCWRTDLSSVPQEPPRNAQAQPNTAQRFSIHRPV